MISNIASLPGWETSPLQHHPSLSRIFSDLPDSSSVPIYTPEWREALLDEDALPKNTIQCPNKVTCTTLNISTFKKSGIHDAILMSLTIDNN